MNTVQKRFLLFIFGCILVRSLFVVIARTQIKYLPYMGALALVLAGGFLYIFFTNSRPTGLEVFGDKIWWNDLRPMHATLYILFAIAAIYKKPYAYIFLLVDVVLGLSAFLYHHYKNGDFKLLF